MFFRRLHVMLAAFVLLTATGFFNDIPYIGTSWLPQLPQTVLSFISSTANLDTSYPCQAQATDRINVRTNAGLKYAVFGTIGANEAIQAYEVIHTTDQQWTDWVRIDFKGQRGYIARDLTDC